MTHWIDWALAVYLGAGLLCGSLFVTAGLSRLQFAHGWRSLPFRLIVLPGAILLWPLVLDRWAKGASKGARPS